MTNSMFLVYVSNPQAGKRLINDVVTVLTNTASGADALLNAALAASVAFKPSTNTDDTESDFYQSGPQFNANYFDTTVAAGAVPGSGNLSADGDAYVMPGRANPIFVAGSSYTPVG